MLLREDGGGGVLEAVEEHPGDVGSGEFLLCRVCGERVTRESARVAVGGSHGHVFCNPHGLVYEVGCFSSAPGCVGEGPFVAEFSWFAGYAWQVALCAGCGALLGWRYRGAEGTGFHGLILPHLERGAGDE